MAFRVEPGKPGKWPQPHMSDVVACVKVSQTQLTPSWGPDLRLADGVVYVEKSGM